MSAADSCAKGAKDATVRTGWRPWRPFAPFADNRTPLFADFAGLALEDWRA
jgi:hypothetical protein